MMRTLLLVVMIAGVVGGCGIRPPAAGKEEGSAAVQTPSTSAEPVAYINGQVVTAAALRGGLMEAVGGQVLSEVVLDRMVADRLAEQGLALTQELVEAERALLVAAMSPSAGGGAAARAPSGDGDETALLLRELRRRRGLGDIRFQSLLRRNAGLRLLVRDQVVVTPDAVRQMYEIVYGPTYTARILVVPSLQHAARLRDQLVEGAQGGDGGEAAFADLAVRHSTDVSSVQGGLLPPISLADPGFPKILRDTLADLDEAGRKLSQVVALEGGYALLRLERKTQGQTVEWADVEKELSRQVRQEAERMLMQQLARQLLAESKVIVLDPALEGSWRHQKEALLGL